MDKVKIKYKIPKPVMPTQEELEDASAKWWDNLKDVSVHVYYDKLSQHMFPLKMVTIPDRIIKELPKVEAMKEDDRFQTMAELQHVFGYCISPALLQLGCSRRFFIKLMSRSPKDYLYEPNMVKPKPLTSTHDALEALQCSMRTFEDLVYMMHLKGVEPYFIVQPYIDFDPKYEFRCFVVCGKVVGITQYYYDYSFDYGNTDMRGVGFDIENVIRKVVMPRVSISTFVVDVVFFNNKWYILELNPYGASDPCLFHSYDNFKSNFLYNDAGVVRSSRI